MCSTVAEHEGYTPYKGMHTVAPPNQARG
jgi:hypothetical protein